MPGDFVLRMLAIILVRVLDVIYDGHFEGFRWNVGARFTVAQAFLYPEACTGWRSIVEQPYLDE